MKTNRNIKQPALAEAQLILASHYPSRQRFIWPKPAQHRYTWQPLHQLKVVKALQAISKSQMPSGRRQWCSDRPNTYESLTQKCELNFVKFAVGLSELSSEWRVMQLYPFITSDYHLQKDLQPDIGSQS